MTVLIEQLSTAAFTPANVLVPPLPTTTGTVVLWSYLGTSLAASQNLMPSAPPIVNAMGTPVYQSNYASFMAGASGNALDSGIRDDNKTFSLLFAVKNPTSLNSPNTSNPIANNDPGTLFGVSVLYSATGLAVATNASGINRTLAVSSVTTWKVFAISYDDAARTQSLWNLTDNTSDTFTGTGSRNLAATSNWWIGANPRTANGNQACDEAFVGMIKGAAINLATAQAYGAHIKASLAVRGLTVL